MNPTVIEYKRYIPINSKIIVINQCIPLLTCFIPIVYFSKGSFVVNIAMIHMSIFPIGNKENNIIIQEITQINIGKTHQSVAQLSEWEGDGVMSLSLSFGSVMTVLSLKSLPNEHVDNGAFVSENDTHNIRKWIRITKNFLIISWKN